MYCALYTVHCLLCTVYCALCTVYCVLCTVNGVLCTVYCVLCNAANCHILIWPPLDWTAAWLPVRVTSAVPSADILKLEGFKNCIIDIFFEIGGFYPLVELQPEGFATNGAIQYPRAAVNRKPRKTGVMFIILPKGDNNWNKRCITS